MNVIQQKTMENLNEPCYLHNISLFIKSSHYYLPNLIVIVIVINENE